MVLHLRVSVPIAWCKNTKDVSCKESFIPVHLTRISKHQCKVTNADDVGMIALEWNGGKGVRNLGECTYIKFPTKNYINYCRSIMPTVAISSALFVANTHKVSPTWGALCNHASAFLKKKTKKMRENVFEKMGGHGNVFFIGEVV